MMPAWRNRVLLACCTLLLAACAVNPVTGQRNLQFYDEQWEQETGANYYAPMRQQQGGDFVLDPELLEYVRSIGQRLASHARREATLDFEFNILNDSTPNAWALPGGKISVNRGLLTELDTEAELAAVLGHEIVHADAAHTARQQSKGVLTQVGALAGMILIGSQADSATGKTAAVLVPAIGAQLLTQKYSRDAEREADEYGMLYMSESGYDPEGAVELQETFVRLSEGRNADWMSGLFASHPPSMERVERNRETARELPQGGETGRDRYQQKTAYLRKIEPAYEAYDRALKAAVREDFRTARDELEKALAIEPRESQFHALEGDLDRAEGRPAEALRAYQQAVSLNPSYFYNRLRRGAAYLETGNRLAAKEDLQRSLDLLPTAQAHFLLGNLARDAGDLATARGHYEKAATSDSEVGHKAQRELARLEIDSRPDKYVATAPLADSGRVFCLVQNRTTIGLTGVSVQARWVDDSGRSRETRETLGAELGPGEQSRIDTGWQTANPATLADRMSCSVTAARTVEQANQLR